MYFLQIAFLHKRHVDTTGINGSRTCDTNGTYAHMFQAHPKTLRRFLLDGFDDRRVHHPNVIAPRDFKSQ